MAVYELTSEDVQAVAAYAPGVGSLACLAQLLGQMPLSEGGRAPWGVFFVAEDNPGWASPSHDIQEVVSGSTVTSGCLHTGGAMATSQRLGHHFLSIYIYSL